MAEMSTTAAAEKVSKFTVEEREGSLLHMEEKRKRRDEEQGVCVARNCRKCGQLWLLST